MLRTKTRDGRKNLARKGNGVRVVMDSLRRIVRDLRLSARDAERGAGISGAQLFVLQTLAESPAGSLNDLAERTLTDQSSVSVVVKRLADRKLLARKASSEDARRIELSLTGAGRRLLARCPEPTQARLLHSLRRLSAPDLAKLTYGLSALILQMGIEDADARMFFDEESPGGARRARRAAARDGS
jgi:DNA-binding MarR family transcriptional regulator